MTQKDKVLILLKAGWCDPMIALNDAGCMRLASRVCDLRKEGYKIEARTKRVLNRWGEECYVKEYRIV